jgi:hypothetical protein
MRGAFLLLLPVALAAQISLRVRVIDNDGAAHAAGSRSAGIAVEVTDEMGKPVPGAVVNVRLPDDGPGGAFASGLSSEIVTTGADGRATTKPISWNRLAGTAEIRVTAVSGRLRAGTIAACRLSEPPPEEKAAVQAENVKPERHGPRVLLKPHATGGGGGHLKWILIGAAAAGGAVAAIGLRGGSATSGGGQQPGGSGAISSITPAGSPVIGHP